MKQTIIFIAISLFALSAFSQSITGTVSDASTGKPISNVNITLDNGSGTSTDANGKFQLAVPAGVNEITISFLGYGTQKVKITDSSQPLNISLVPGNTQLGEVVISSDSMQLHQARSIGLLTARDFDRNSGLSLQNSLNLIPGVQMSTRSPWGGQHIIIRGYYPSADNGRTDQENFNGYGYQLYIDNIPVTDATGSTIMDDIDLSNLGKVEVVKGPDPLYGSYIAGAVNLFTPVAAPGQTSINEELIGGSYGMFRDNTGIECGGSNSSIWVNYGHQTYDGFRTNDGSKKDYASFAGNFNVSTKQTLSTYFSYNHSYEGLAGEIDSAAFYNRLPMSDSNYVLNNSHVEIESFRAGVTDRYQFCKQLSNQTTLFATGHTLNQYFAHGFSLDNNLSFGGRTAFNYLSQSDHLTVDGTLGISFQKSTESAQGNFILPFVLPPFNPSTSPDFPSDVQEYGMNYSLFTKWNFSLPSDFSFSIGAAANYEEFGYKNLLVGNNGGIYIDAPWYVKSFDPAFTPSASISKVFNKNISVYASVSAGYTPALIGDMLNSAGQVDSALKPERAIQFEIGSKGSVADGKLNYQVAFFDIDITNRLVQETSNSISYYTNAGEQRNLGAELSLSYDAIKDKNSAITAFRPWITYTCSDFEYADFKNFGRSSSGGDTVLTDYSGNKVAAVAPNVFNIGIDLDTRPGIYLNTTFQYVDKVPVTFDNKNYMKAYDLLGAKIGYRKQFGKFSMDIFAGADNILGSTYYNLIFVGQNIQELAQGNDPAITGGGDGYILPAPYKATFYGGGKLSFNF